MEYFLS